MRKILKTVILFLVCVEPAATQSLDLAIKNYGISIGDSRRINGLRLNFRDQRLRQVNGINATFWMPHEPARGHVKGLALGLPLTGAEKINGIAIGIFGAGAEASLKGIAMGLVGVGAGQDISGIMIAGIGAGSGADIKGIGIAGIGLGSGGDIKGIMISGIGVGSGGDVKGITFGGIGVGSGGDMLGLNIGGIGVGAGGSITGISISVVGVGAGESISGITIAGVAVGSGNEIKGITIGGVAVGAPNLKGLVAGLSAGAQEFKGLALTPAYFRITDNGLFRGISVSAFNHIKGEHRGLSIGILNFANDLYGVQIGLINIARSNPKGLKVLPVFNADFN